MDAKRANWLAPLLVAAFLTLPIAYIGAYFITSDTNVSEPAGLVKVRIYQTDWQVKVFAPAAVIESAVTGREVVVLRR